MGSSITFPAKEPIGITSYRTCMLAQIWNWPLAQKVRRLSKCFSASAGEPQRVLHAMAAMLPKVGKGEHEPGDAASKSFAPAWPSVCVRARRRSWRPVKSASYSPRPVAISLFQPRLPLCALCCALTYLRPPRLCSVEPALKLHRGALSHGNGRGPLPEPGSQYTHS